MLKTMTKAYWVFVCSQSRRQTEHTKNGGAPWLPESPEWKTTTRPFARADTVLTTRKKQQKRRKRPISNRNANLSYVLYNYGSQRASFREKTAREISLTECPWFPS